jgi:magnesium chelatase subunit H
VAPAYNDAHAAEEILAKLDVPYIAAHPVEFQTLDQWGGSDRGLLPVESTIMVAIPELDGSTIPMVYGGRPGADGVTCTGCQQRCTFTKDHKQQDMFTCTERTAMLSARVGKLVDLRRSQRAQRKVAMVIFNFPPNSGNTGTAAYLAVFESLYNTMVEMKAQGYTVDLPESVDALREGILYGNAKQYGADANVHTLIPAEQHIRREKWLTEIEAQWGPAPGKQLTNGQSIFVMGQQYGNLLVAVQPSFGYEGDPMRLLFEKGFAPTHAFRLSTATSKKTSTPTRCCTLVPMALWNSCPANKTACQRCAGQTGMIGELPNFYLYASNNPSEGAIAKRRAAATLVSYLTPPVAESGLYAGLAELKVSIDRWRSLDLEQEHERAELMALVQAQAAELNLVSMEPAWTLATNAPFEVSAAKRIQQLGADMLELEYTLIPHGLHVVGRAPTESERVDMLMAMAEASYEAKHHTHCN